MIVNKIFNRIKDAKLPLWFQWNLFPKDGQPLTLSVFEFILYLIVSVGALYLFIAFNRIPYHTFSISAQKLTNNRYIDTIVERNDTNIYFCFQTAKIVFQIPRTTVFAKDSFDICSYEINKDHIKIENLNLVSDTTSTLLTGGMSQYWRAVFDNVAERFEETFNILRWNHKRYENNSLRDELEGIGIVNSFLGYPLPTERLNNILYPNKRKRYSKNSGRIIMPPSMTNKDLTEYWDSVFDNSTPLNLNHYSIFWDKYINHLRKNNNPKRVFERISEQRTKDVLFPKVWSDNSRIYKWKDKYYFALSSSTNKTENKGRPWVDSIESNHFSTHRDMLKKYDKNLGSPTYIIESFNVARDENMTEKQVFKSYNNPIFMSNISVQSPGWFDLYDISQGWYKILFNTSTIDSTEITVDFVGATDIYPMKIEPDEKGSSYIKFTHPDKILQIRKEGLTFYAHFIELDKRQTIRAFAVTAVLSGLVIVLITFIILGLYRVPRIIRKIHKYDDMQRLLAYQRRHKANIFDVFFKDMENISDEKIVSIIKETAKYFQLPVPVILNTCETIAKIMTSENRGECEIYYDWELMKKVGINNTDTLRLSIIHELSHQVLYETRFLLFENELWIQELAADMMVGAFSSIGDDVATGKYKYVLRQLPASLTHPDGKLRASVVEYGREYITLLRKQGEVDDIREVLKGLPAFVYAHYQELQESWSEVQLDDDKEDAPVETTPIDYEALPDTNLLKQYYLKYKERKEDDI